MYIQVLFFCIKLFFQVFILMKKVCVLFLLLLWIVSCGSQSDDITKAKQDLGVIDKPEWQEESLSVNSLQEASNDTNSEENWNSNDFEKELDVWWDVELSETWDDRIQINYISGKKVLELNDLTYKEFKAGVTKIIWKTLWNVSKITVSFSNNDSDFPNDLFTLRKFTAWDATFEYNASSRFKVLDFWLNRYQFKAVHDEWESVMELLVMVSEWDDISVVDSQKRESFIDSKNMQKEVEAQKKAEIVKDFDISTLPEWWEYGNVVELGNWSFTYSDIKWLEIKKAAVWNLSCATSADWSYPLSDFVTKNYKSWPYWNTCHDIISWKGISFFVIRLTWDSSYVYERHYIDTNHWLVATYELEKWEWVTSENIAEKSKEMKLRNGDFAQLSVVDGLFKKIVE